MPVRWEAVRLSDSPVRAMMGVPCGSLVISACGETLSGLAWVVAGAGPGGSSDGRRWTQGLASVCAQLAAYFHVPHDRFACRLAERGTPFHRRVWQALLEIPPGRPCTYGELARRLGTAARAVAGACRANPYPVIVPCHRVVAHNGIGGYCGQDQGAAVAIKRWLLRHEGWDGA